MQPTFKYVEDYLELIAGYRDAAGTQLATISGSPLSLARYDVNVVNSIAAQTLNGHAMTDRQGLLAIRLIYKYERQLRRLDPPVYLPEDLHEFRLGERKVDRSKSIRLAGDAMLLKFPFESKLIAEVRRQAKEGQGHCVFNGKTKEWILPLTESMVNWAVTMAAANDINIDESILAMFEQILAVEQQPYKIELVEQHGQLLITNAADSLVEHIQKNLGGFHHDNLFALVDNAPVLGYTVSQELLARATQDLAPLARELVSKRTTKLNQKGGNLQDILAYARISNRLPICVHDTGLGQCQNTDEVIFLTRHADANIRPRLMVSFSAFVIGAKKKNWLNNAEKVVIVNHETFNNSF